jgi:predicted Rossmann fold nucleotide-binding protein DprA/Smf involved in DNA uptake
MWIEKVISGCIRGIDTNAHLAGLEKDRPATIILSFGILEYSRKKVFENLERKGNGLGVTQFCPREKWHARSAPMSNRLVCALSKAVIIIESCE